MKVEHDGFPKHPYIEVGALAVGSLAALRLARRNQRKWSIPFFSGVADIVAGAFVVLAGISAFELGKSVIENRDAIARTTLSAVPGRRRA